MGFVPQFGPFRDGLVFFSPKDHMAYGHLVQGRNHMGNAGGDDWVDNEGIQLVKGDFDVQWGRELGRQ